MRVKKDDISYVSPEMYDEDYFLKHRAGAEEFRKTKGKTLHRKHSLVLRYAEVQKDEKIIDIGCGCGEIVIHSGAKGAYAIGLDYSMTGLLLAKKAASQQLSYTRGNVSFLKSVAWEIPFASEIFDKVFLIDLIEHLPSKKTAKTLEEIKRIMKPSGVLIIHTWPNVWFYNYIHPIIYIFRTYVARQNVPFNPRDKYDQIIHINEQSPLKLAKILRKSGFKYRIWLYPSTDSEKRTLYGILSYLLQTTWPFKFLFCCDIWGKALK